MTPIAKDAEAEKSRRSAGAGRRPYAEPRLEKRDRLARIAAMSDTVTSVPLSGR